MQHTDLKEFNTIIYETAQAFMTDLTPGMAKIHWNAYADLTIDQVREAFSQHIATANRFPVPAQIRELANAGKPATSLDIDADEAWTIAVQASDERDSVVWTETICIAWGQVRDVFEFDEVGARMAFRQIYSRLIAEHRAAGNVPAWELSAGYDAVGRVDAIEAAGRLGRHVHPKVREVYNLPPASVGIKGLLESASNARESHQDRHLGAEDERVGDGGASGSEAARIALQALKEMLGGDDTRKAEAERRRKERQAELDCSKERQLQRLKQLELDLEARKTSRDVQPQEVRNAA